jgi:hypothetical protein
VLRSILFQAALPLAVPVAVATWFVVAGGETKAVNAFAVFL